MAKEQMPVRDYKFSDGKLVQLADDYILLTDRDFVKLAEYGITGDDLDNLKNMRTGFADYPTDEELLGLLVVATKTKNKHRDTVETAVRSIMVRVEDVFKNDSGILMQFGVGSISKETDANFIRTATRVHRVATGMQAELNAAGVTVTYLADFKAKVKLLDEALDSCDTAQRNRAAATRERILKGNELYKAIVRIASFGKDAFYSTNEAKYEDYVIIERENEAGSQRSGSLQSAEIKNMDYPDITITDSFKIQNTGTTPIQVYFAETTVAVPGDNIFILDQGVEITRSATDLGYTEFKPFLNLRNNETTVATYKVNRT